MTEQIVDIIEANMPCSSDVANVAYGAGAAAGGDMARTVATSVATSIATDLIRTDTAEVKKELRDGLSAKVDINGSGQVTMLNLANDVKQAMGGGGVHIWDETTDDLEAEIASATRFGYRRQTAVSLLDLDDPHASGVYVLYSNGNVLTAPGGHPVRVYVLPVRPGTLYMTGDVGNQGGCIWCSRRGMSTRPRCTPATMWPDTSPGVSTARRPTVIHTRSPCRTGLVS